MGNIVTDDLRTRIAAVLAEAQETHNGISDLALADAVIRELKQQWRADYGYDGYQKCGTREEAVQRVQEFNASLGDDWQDGEQAMVMTRHVTEWETTDE